MSRFLPLSLALSSILWLPICTQAHMQMSWPYPLRSPLDPDVPVDEKDYDMTSPLLADGSNFPCKNYQNDTDGYVTKATYISGGTYDMWLNGTTEHDGGSCQLSLSYDNGVSFKVIKSMIGGCPLTHNYNFTIPSFAPSSDSALLSWSWFNLVGNREMYQNCARVQIISGPNQRYRRASPYRRQASSMDQLPDMFVCNVGNGCQTIEGQEVVFPDPGNDVVYGQDAIVPGPGPGFTIQGVAISTSTSSGSVASTTAASTLLDASTTTSDSASSTTTIGTTTTVPSTTTTGSGSAAMFFNLSTTLVTTTTTTTFPSFLLANMTTTSSPFSSGTSFTTNSTGTVTDSNVFMIAPTTTTTTTTTAATTTASDLARSDFVAYSTTTTPTLTTSATSTLTSTSFTFPITRDTIPTTFTTLARVASTSTSSSSTSATSLPLPCAPGTFTCNTLFSFSQCIATTTGTTYIYMGPVAPGTTCVDGQIVRENDGPCTPNGALFCNGERSFYLCDQGGLADMGPVAPATVCRNGEIVAAR
ncbi:uncharacterized protein Z519_01776 [Cladophialophora bantiana CBS 173.52]|uniref:Carbohydrate-binding module family 19 domain-containing protein n=1 Tax=Cladophialophora bantiana (strain ATCC 10958 / CBS 173.52 / CDC B-1940 / NIH 8579) TaxID=1442370 RepID=A0A0D2GIJ1_CLAB1|nr:uncharacterized protein Z519_01776 [Cladophialophora bantiana CBS 173.52]KIW98192.1 hypothetical protein Z519_01776 [Cladophialophora bantiana CBS 173.52]